MEEKMKKMLFLMLFLLILGAANVNSQVRIGGNEAPHEAAVLDLNVDNTAAPANGGLALPRVSLNTASDKLNNTDPINGMLVYSTGGTLKDGFYLWKNDRWIKLDADSRPERLVATVNTNRNVAYQLQLIVDTVVTFSCSADSSCRIHCSGIRHSDLCSFADWPNPADVRVVYDEIFVTPLWGYYGFQTRRLRCYRPKAI